MATASDRPPFRADFQFVFQELIGARVEQARHAKDKFCRGFFLSRFDLANVTVSSMPKRKGQFFEGHTLLCSQDAQFFPEPVHVVPPAKRVVLDIFG
jgi:hypothetical protein